ncbi:MAG: hypothetical protein WC969_13690 [Elusimicrobiota bacterium]|jgi:transcriptional regulator with XRE-family HTH domain
MGILHNREELIPVTCAVLSDEDRREFFGKVRRKAGKTERIAQACSVTPGVVADWMSGKSLVPYHALMRMAQEFAIDPPQVTELRREYQPVFQTLPAPRPAAPPPARREAQREPRPEKRREGAPRGAEGRRAERSSSRRERPARGTDATRREGTPSGAEGRRKERSSPRREPRQKAAGREESQGRGRRQPERKAAPRQDPKVPSGKTKYSDRLAYWTGALLAAGRRADDGVRFQADRVIGQNFAATWARLTDQLFEVKPQLSLSEDHHCQVAFLPIDACRDFEARLELKLGAEAPAAPRWTWSNPDWKAAFLRGVVDASAHFHRTPSLNLLGLSEQLRGSAQKILASLGYPPKQKEDGTILLEDAGLVEKYFETIGTENLKLRDQFNAWKRSRSGEPRPGGRTRRGGRPEGAPENTGSSASPAAEVSEATAVVDAPAPDAAPVQEWAPPKLEQPFAEPAQPFPPTLPDADATQDDSY